MQPGQGQGRRPSCQSRPSPLSQRGFGSRLGQPQHKKGTGKMFHRIAAWLCAAAWLSVPALAQMPMRARPPEAFKYIPGKEVEALTNKPGPGVKTAFPVDHEDYDVEYAERSDKGNEPEVHTYRTHYIHVISGESVLTYGGTVTNARETAPGQIRGDGIS